MCIRDRDYIGHARNGTILPLDDYLKDTERYPIESMIAYDNVYQKFLVDGKSYGIPCLNQPGGCLLYTSYATAVYRPGVGPC